MIAKKTSIASVLQSAHSTQLHYIVLALFLGFGPFMSSVALIFFLAVTLSSVFLSRSFRVSNKKHLLFSSLLVVYLICYSYAYNLADATDFLYRCSPIFILPLIISRDQLDRSAVNKIKSYFAKGMTLSVLLILGIAIFKYITGGNHIAALTYYNLASYLSFHPTYYSLYVVTALIFLLDKEVKIPGSIRVIGFVLFTTAILLLQSRIGQLGFILVIAISVFRQDKKSYKLALLAVMASAVAGLLLIPGNRDRIMEANEVEETKLIGGDFENGITQRIWLWSTAMEQIGERPLLGYGLRSQRNYFSKRVHKEALATELSVSEMKAVMQISKMNLHNQYLQITYDAGLTGIVIFVISILLILRFTDWQLQFDFLIAFTVLLLFLLSENILDRQHGIFLFAFLYPVLFSKNNLMNADA